MKRMIKRILSVLLVAVMLLTAAPLSGFVGLDIDFSWLDFSAKSSALSSSGSCGDDVTYTFDEDTGLLTISGTGAMRNYGSSESPFYNNSSIKSVFINNGVTSIGVRAFLYCTGLTSITIPDSVTSMGDYAFGSCTGLISISISESVTNIGSFAFSGCSGLKSITVDSNNTVYDSRENCNAIIETETNTLIKGCRNTIIPDSVISIGCRAFLGCTGLKNITIPDSVTSIDSATFWGCSDLTKITISDKVTSICEYSFYSCKSLTNITIPDGVTSIGNSAFENCAGLTSVAIPDSVTSIGDYAFYCCRGLTSVKIPSSTTQIGKYTFDTETDDGLSLFVFDGSYAKDYAIENGISFCVVSQISDNVNTVYGEIGDNLSWFIDKTTGTLEINCANQMTSFNDDVAPWITYKEYIKHIVVNDGCTIIGTKAFMNCERVVDVSLPNNVEYIGSCAFMGCVNLKEIKIPDKVTAICESVFYSCSSLTKIIIPEGITSIFNDAFYNCSSITDLYIPNTVNFIGRDSFYSCISLNELTIPCSCKSDSSFIRCNIERIIITAGKGTMENYRITTQSSSDAIYYEDTPWYENRDTLKEIIIDDGVMNISAYAFYNCIGLEKVTISDYMYYIGQYAFFGCKDIVSVSMPKTIGYIEESAFQNCISLSSIIIPNTSFVGSYAFHGCTSLSDLTISCYVEKICDGVFIDCTSLTSVVLPDSVTDLGKNVFYGCINLTSVDIGDGVTDLEKNVFDGCINLTSVDIGDGVTEIYESAFKDFLKLENVKIGKNIERIGSSAFSGCIGLKELVLPCSAKIIDESTFLNCTNIKKITIEKGTGTMQDYSIINYNKAPWFISRKNVEEIILEDGIMNIGNYSFFQCENLANISIPNSVIKIGQYAFYGCRGLTNIIIPNKLANIEDYAFGYCTNLTNAIIPNGVTNIGVGAFECCDSLTNVTIPCSVTSIEAYTFFYCTGLTSFVIPMGVTTVDDYAFSNCSSLKEIIISDSVTKIGANVFEDCYSLISITIPSSVTKIGYSLFNNENYKYLFVYEGSYAEQYAINQGLKYRIVSKIPDDIDTVSGKITNKFFWSIDKTTGTLTLDCSGAMVSFENDVAPWIQYEEYIKHIIIKDGCTNIGKSAFMLLDKAESVYIPNSITSIDDSSFDRCISLNEISIPDSVNNIGNYAFQYCRNLSNKLIIPESVICIGDYAFFSCDSLLNITVSNADISLGDYSFSYCTKLKELTLPCSTSLLSNTFNGTENIEKVTITKGTGIFKNCTYTKSPWYYSRGCIKQIIIENGVRSIGDYAFWNCYGITNIEIPDSVIDIGFEAFKGCANLKKVKIGSNVTTIGKYAFNSCKSLDEMILPYNVNYIGVDAYTGCTSLNKITIYNRYCTFADDATAYYTTIYGFTSSTAETYASEKGFDFVAIDYIHEHVYDNDCDAICNLCGAERLVHYTLTPVNGAVVDNENGLIYGITSNSADINSYVNTVDGTMSVQYNSDVIGTGGVVNIVKDGAIVDSYKVVIFGDVDGDGWYDGQDAITVSCLANGMLTREQVGEAVWMAADCNHDGVIDQLDVDLLNQAGVLLSSVDQTKPTEELLETSAEYNEYLSLIDQMGSEDAPETPTQDENDSFLTRIIALIESIVKFVNKIFTKIF